MKKVVVLMFLILSIGLVAAHVDYNDHDYVFKEKISETKYYLYKAKVVTTTMYIDYDNENRHSTYDYRHGYTYRATTEYLNSWKKDYDRSYVKKDYGKRYDWNYHKYSSFDEGKIYYYKDVPHMRGFVKKSCYKSAPRGKLFYIKC